MAELFLEEGVDKDTKNRWKRTPLEEAIKNRWNCKAILTFTSRGKFRFNESVTVCVRSNFEQARSCHRASHSVEGKYKS